MIDIGGSQSQSSCWSPARHEIVTGSLAACLMAMVMVMMPYAHRK